MKENFKELKQEFEKIVRQYTEIFCKKMYGEASSPEDFWVADDIGGVLCVGDEYWGLEQIRKTVDNDYDPKQVFAWYDYCLRLGTIDNTIPVPNLEQWMNGCPIYSEEQISRVEEAIRTARESVESLKGNIPRKEQ